MQQMHSSKGHAMHDGTDIRAQLERERHIIEAATEGPWEADSLEGDLTGPEGGFVMEVLAWRDPDAAFITHARTALPVRNAQIEAVLELCRDMHAAYESDPLGDAIAYELERAIQEAP